MSKIDKLITQKRRESPEFDGEFQKEMDRMISAVAVKRLRDDLHLTQREFASLVGKPQSTIARIESGATEASMATLREIAEKTEKKIEILFV